VEENNTSDILNPETQSDVDSLTSTSDITTSTNSNSSDDSTSSIALSHRRFRKKRNGRKRANAKFSTLEFNRLENEKDMRRKINKLHPYPGHNSGLSVLNTIDVFDITFGIEPDQLEIIDWNIGKGRLGTLRFTSSTDVVDTETNSENGDNDVTHLSTKQSSCPCCRYMGTDTEDEMSSNFDAQYRRNKVAHDVIVAPYFMAINKSNTGNSGDNRSHTEHSGDFKSETSQPLPGSDPPNINIQDASHSLAW